MEIWSTYVQKNWALFLFKNNADFIFNIFEMILGFNWLIFKHRRIRNENPKNLCLLARWILKGTFIIKYAYWSDSQPRGMDEAWMESKSCGHYTYSECSIVTHTIVAYLSFQLA